MPTGVFTPTEEQARAIRTTGRSVIVSAAAGSGKTAVLAQRCAYLVCDAPVGERCDIDRLLVLTFTEAAAGEMRSRIVDSIRSRLSDRPGDRRLGEQVALADSAQISTIHSFCLWLVRRWFNRVGVDPTATVLDADEASLLKKEVLDAVFTELYARVETPDDPLGRAELETSASTEGGAIEQSPSAPGDAAGDGTSPVDLAGWAPGGRGGATLGPAFVQLVEDYGLGDERTVAGMVLRLFEFAGSLPDPAAWLGEAVSSLIGEPESVVLSLAAELLSELEGQAEHCASLAEALEECRSEGHFHAAQIRTYAEQVGKWAAELVTADESDSKNRSVSLLAYESVRQAITEFEFDKARAPRLPKDADEQGKKTRKDAGELYSKQVKAGLFKKRLLTRFALFSTDELISGLGSTAPYVATLADLVVAFQEAYTIRKRRLNVLDFTDLERLAFELLCDTRASPHPDGKHEASDVARTLHRRYAHVLVDEFQDINPIQQAILRLVSRESDLERSDNLFVVGDVKQSIYRFRLAEPALFADRLHRFREGREEARGVGDAPGSAIFLQSNFRSRPEILEAVNLVFRRLYGPGIGGIEYDDKAELQPGRPVDPASARESVELHLLERKWGTPGHDEGEGDKGEDGGGEESALPRAASDLSDPARWTPIEREAFLIGSRIRDWMGESSRTSDGTERHFSDVVILLRAARVNAERIAGVLTSMGIPAYAEVGGSLFGALEVREVLAALKVLDNFQQDIPLASVLRSGVFGDRLSEDDLVEIRCLDRSAAFHEVVRRYVAEGEDSKLRGRVGALWDRINRHRDAVTRRPLAETLWRLYEEDGYLAHACGLPNGMQRRANLHKLHDLARKFGTFRRQGLHRFLAFVQSLESEKREVALAPTVGESEDVVRIMSIHRSKGLEFPVVFVAGLGTRFNLGDRDGRMIFERSAKIGLRVVDTRRMVEYPSAAHTLVAHEIERATREEEMRVLYVAMTRARDKLVLVGSRNGVEDAGESAKWATPSGPPSRLSVATATTPLDWLLPCLAGAPEGSIDGAKESVFSVRVHGVAEMAGWSMTVPTDASRQAVRTAIARCEPLPDDEPTAHDDPEVAEVLGRLQFVYPRLASSSVRATMAAGELKGAYDFTRDPDERPSRTDSAIPAGEFEIPPSKYTADAKSGPIQRGITTHRVLEHLDFAVALDARGVASELQRMVESGLLPVEDRPAVLEDAVAWFVSTPLAEAIRDAGPSYRREFRYVTTEPVTFFDASLDAAPDDRVLVRGMVDGVWSSEEALEIVDFKTDAVRAEEVPDRCERYRPQMALYSRAVSRIWNKPVSTCWLVFLTPRLVIPIRDATAEQSAL